ncbi:SRPBCC domain-containing protein [Patulibacter sp. NPDC049589]|uniref:SRPBCC family protein n=1 Tax=Patulibacter sp. NPDC049589 TaxID=3154731 RepID=UPI003448AEB2
MRRELVLDAAPDDVWAQVADDDGLAGWLADEVDLDVREGATGTVRDAGGRPRPVEVDEVVPGRRLGLVWRDEDDRPALVDIALEPFGAAGTRVVIVEVPLETVRLVAPAADRMLAVGRPGGRGAHGGAQGPTATAAGRVLAGVR